MLLKLILRLLRKLNGHKATAPAQKAYIETYNTNEIRI
jgi:hypothetical protein